MPLPWPKGRVVAAAATAAGALCIAVLLLNTRSGGAWPFVTPAAEVSPAFGIKGTPSVVLRLLHCHSAVQCEAFGATSVAPPAAPRFPCAKLEVPLPPLPCLARRPSAGLFAATALPAQHTAAGGRRAVEPAQRHRRPAVHPRLPPAALQPGAGAAVPAGQAPGVCGGQRHKVGSWAGVGWLASSMLSCPAGAEQSAGIVQTAIPSPLHPHQRHNCCACRRYQYLTLLHFLDKGAWPAPLGGVPGQPSVANEHEWPRQAPACRGLWAGSLLPLLCPGCPLPTTTTPPTGSLSVPPAACSLSAPQLERLPAGHQRAVWGAGAV
jgi:hypothetical protein